MSHARPFGQAPVAASPWSSGAPPGLMQQQQAQAAPQVQPMFNQPMGAFDISGAGWQSQQATPVGQSWVTPMQQVQFVPNPAFIQHQQQMQQQHQHHQHQHQQMQQQHQRPMQQRSLSAPRVSNGGKRPMNQNTNFAGPQQFHAGNNWSHNRGQNQFSGQNRSARQQSRMNNQKGQFNHNNYNNSNNNNNSGNFNNNIHNKNQQNPVKQQQQQQSNQSVNQQQANRPQIRKVTKVKKLSAIRAKQQTNGNTVSGSDDAAGDSTATDASNHMPKAQSKTAERKQLKLQARKNAEGLKHSKLTVAKTSKGASASDKTRDGSDSKVDEPIDQAQLKCVPAVFGFVCKLCNVFLRDKEARREHIDSSEHMEKFKAHEEEQQKALAQKEANEAAEAAAVRTETVDDEPASEQIGSQSSADDSTKLEIDQSESVDESGNRDDASTALSDVDQKTEVDAPESDAASKTDS